jgi:hypothetical protein
MSASRSFLLPAALAIGLVATDARADTISMVSRANLTRDTFALAFVKDGTWGVSFAYARKFASVFLRKFPVQIELAYTQPLVLIPGYDGAKLAFAASGMYQWRNKWGVSAGVGPDVMFSKDDVGKRIGFGAEIFARPAYWGDQGMVALDVGYRIGYASCVVHGQAVADLYGDRYPGGAPAGAATGPEDGCIPAASHRLRTGALLGLAGGEGAGFIAGGFEYHPNIDGVISAYPLTGLPFYLQITFSYFVR